MAGKGRSGRGRQVARVSVTLHVSTAKSASALVAAQGPGGAAVARGRTATLEAEGADLKELQRRADGFLAAAARAEKAGAAQRGPRTKKRANTRKGASGP